MDLLYKQQGHEPLRPAVHLIRCASSIQTIILLLVDTCRLTVLGICKQEELCGHREWTDVPLTSCMQAIEVVRRVSPKIKAPIIMFTYFNPIMRRGSERFCQQIKEAGASGPPLALHLLGKSRDVSRPRDMRVRHCLHVAHPTLSQLRGPACLQGLEDCMKQGAFKSLPTLKQRSFFAGLLVPDIPLEETGPVRQVATAAGLELVLLTTPTTPTERMEAIAKVSQGFVYLVSVTGAPLLSHDESICTEPKMQATHTALRQRGHPLSKLLG